MPFRTASAIPFPPLGVPAEGAPGCAGPAARVRVIVNPTAGAGRADRLAHLLRGEIARRLGPHHAFDVTERPGDATGLAAQAVADGATLVVAVGGDGTIHEVVNGLLGDGRPRRVPVTLGIVDCGTGRGLAASLGLPTALDAQLYLLAGARTVAIDVGHVLCRDADGRPVGRWFVSECQVGIGAAIVAGLRPWLKRLGGSLGFGLVALGRALGHRAAAFRVAYGGLGTIARPLLGLAVGNGDVTAGGMRLTPDARLNDGLFDVLAIDDMPLPTRIANFPSIYAGTHVRSPHFALRRASRVTVSADPPAPVAADGELLGFTPARLTLVPSALRIRAGALPRD